MVRHKLKLYAPYAYKGHCPSGSTVEGCELCGQTWGLEGLVETRGEKNKDGDTCEEQQKINATHDWQPWEHRYGRLEDMKHTGWKCSRCGTISNHQMLTPFCELPCAEFAMKQVVG